MGHPHELQRLDRAWYDMDSGYDETQNPFADVSEEYTVPLKSKLPVASRFRRDANRVARYANRVARYAIRVARESSKRKMSGIN